MTTLLRAILALALLAGESARAQTPVAKTGVAETPMKQNAGVIGGRVTDETGAAIYGAVITIQAQDGSTRTTVSDTDGSFQVSSLTAGSYTVRVAASGLADGSISGVAAGSAPLTVALKVAPAVTTVNVGLPPQELAREQIKIEEKQRALGVIPNYYVTYVRNAAPLNWQQKMQLGLKTVTDPTTIAASAITAGIQQQQNSYPQFKQGAEGYFKRLGANYATSVNSVLIGGVLMDSLLRQDPRYFYSGEGSRVQRLGYAMWASFFVKGDNGKWQFPYSDLTGLVASAELSQTYLPGSRTQITLLGRGLLFRFAGRVALNVAEEFFLKKVTTNVPPDKVAGQTVLREGTPVPLIAMDGLTAEGASLGKTVNFVLAQDLTVDGRLIVRRGELVSGQVEQMTGEQSEGDVAKVGLEQVRLKAGSVNVPLRSNQVRGAAQMMQFKELPDSKKLEVILYVAESVRVPAAQ